MTTKIAKSKRGLFGSLIVFAVIFIISGGAFGRIPEPDNIVYGVAREDAVTITMEVGGASIASYTMGDNPDAGVFYILRVPMDALEPADTGTAHTGDEAFIYINDDTQPIVSVIIGERGAIHRVDLGTTDNDFDDIPDQWEKQICDASSTDDIEYPYQVKPEDDFDYDGYCNYREYLAGSHPVDTEKIPHCFADVNTDGDVDGGDLSVFVEEYPYGTCECPSDTDGDGDIDEWDLLFLSEDMGRTDCF